MSAETDLSKLLRHMQPRLNEGTYIFCSLPEETRIPIHEVLATFREEEGLSVLLSQATADRYQIPYHFEAAWLTLTVHSALEAVGLTAAVATALAKKNISCNVVAAFYHDHIFVAKEQATEALAILEGLGK